MNMRMQISATPLVITDDEEDESGKDYRATLSEISDNLSDGIINNEDFSIENIKENEFSLIRLAGKKPILYYVARVMLVDGEEYKVQFLRRKENTQLFFYPEVEEIYDINIEDFVIKLPAPMMIGGTARAASYHKFEIDFSKYVVT